MRFNLALIGLITIAAFQNCAKTQAANPSPAPEAKSEIELESAASFNQIVYDSQLEFSSVSSNGHVEVDLTAGTASITLDQSTYACNLDQSRLQSLRKLMSTSQICEPGPLPPGTAICLAIAEADLKLANSTASILLRPAACNNGTFLCDGNDSKLRGILADLKTNLPTDCVVQ